MKKGDEPVVEHLLRDPTVNLRLAILATRLAPDEQAAIARLAYEENYDIRGSDYCMDADLRKRLVELGLLVNSNNQLSYTLSYHGLALATIAGLGD